MDREITELTATEIEWVNTLLQELIDRAIPPYDIHALSNYYDVAYAACQAGPVSADEEPNAVVNRVGAGLGEYLRSRLPVRWVVVTDEWGTDLALHHPTRNITTAPMSMVGKRWNEAETGFLPDLAAQAISRIASVIASHGE